jgi:VWFA-related protein
MGRFGAILLAAILSSNCLAQQKPADSQSTVTLRSNPRLVLVNVIATDDAGNPVHRLSKDDFKVFEDGQQQGLRAFEEHSATLENAEAPKPVELDLGPGVHTNYIPLPKDFVTNILLFDMLNMSNKDLIQAKAELMKTVGKLPRGQQFALFVMGNQLHMVTGFTWDRDALYLAASKIANTNDAAYTDQRMMSQQIGELKQTMLIKNPKAFAELVQSLESEDDTRVQARAMYTFDGLSQLARSVAAIPGRKNLIWITGGFPFDPSRGDMDRFSHISAQLAASQVAIYPIDARGVITNQPDASTGDAEIFSVSGAGAYTGYLQSLTEETRATYETMFDLAAQTGGRAFINQNTFLPAISKIIDTGANYYTLAYRPANQHFDGHFRKIEVRSGKHNLKLLYRTGYYAVDDPLQLPRMEDRERALQVAMQAGAPPSTTLIVKTRVIPPVESRDPAVLDYLVDVTALGTAADKAEPKKKDLDVIFAATAYDDGGKLVSSRSWAVKMALTDDDLTAMKRTGLQLHQDYALKPGNYRVRLGVLDRNSGKIGTLDVPVNVPEAEPAK